MDVLGTQGQAQRGLELRESEKAVGKRWALKTVFLI
jgi:hypothetical protein